MKANRSDPGSEDQRRFVMNDDISAWFDALAGDQRVLALQLRDLVRAHAPDLREELKWGQPCYSARSLVCYIQKARAHVSLGFSNGAALVDPEAQLHGSGGRMRHVKIALGTEPDHASLGRLIDAALALDAAP